MKINEEKAELLNKFLVYCFKKHLTLLFRTQILKLNVVVISQRTCYIPRNLYVSSYLLMYLSVVGAMVSLLRCSNIQQSILHQLLHLYLTSPLRKERYLKTEKNPGWFQSQKCTLLQNPQQLSTNFLVEYSEQAPRKHICNPNY